MLFQTFSFFVFFATFVLAYYSLRRHLAAQNTAVLIGSYIFYGAWDERFLILIIASTATDYLSGIGASGRNPDKTNLMKATSYLILGGFVAFGFVLDESYHFLFAVAALAVAFWVVVAIGKGLSEAARRKYYVGFSIVVNLGLLATFKYLNFFADSLQSLAKAGGYELDFVTLEIVLPVGISFYTFQTLSYSIDIYRGKIKPTDSFLELAAFVAFFPQLVAGPIERAANLLPQFQKLRQMDFENIRTGATLFVWGLFKKVYIADNLAPIADNAFTNPYDLTSGALFTGLLAFTFQIYCDFSGYSDMARGTSRILGFKLMLNFKLPYLSRTPSEFWQCWHISLSSWLRDYLYVSLGGNRGGSINTYRNLSLTMLLGGLWHGASWTFVLWGGFQGLILVIYRVLNVDEKLTGLIGETRIVRRFLVNAVAILIMFALTMYGWLIFRANSVDVLTAYTHNLLSINGSMDWTGLSKLAYYVIPLLLVQIIQIVCRKLEFFWDMPVFIRWNIALFVLYSVGFLQPSITSAFIYFDF